jgi:hypothetical protein
MLPKVVSGMIDATANGTATAASIALATVQIYELLAITYGTFVRRIGRIE